MTNLNGSHTENERRLLIITDAWYPQINGVVRTLTNTLKVLNNFGYKTYCINPTLFPTLPCPFYNEIRLSLPLYWRFRRLIHDFDPTHIHISTEGPLGLMARFYCTRHNLRYTTAFHTVFPEYAYHIARIPRSLSWMVFRWFHKNSCAVMVATNSMIDQLKTHGFKNLVLWCRGIDSNVFNPRTKQDLNLKRPILLYVGRVSKEKNIEAFLTTQAEGTKVIVGDGPYKPALEKKYPACVFLGYKTGEELSQAYADADIFVFPSKTDTFGVVLLEALASGLPVAAYPAPGPIDIIRNTEHGSINENLALAIKAAVKYGKAASCIEYALSFTWDNCTKQFASYLVSCRDKTEIVSPTELTENEPLPINSPSA